MALGSSAPEILLNVVEITTGGFMAGALGPSTIVGSAAFNLLVILGVCVAAITEGTRRIEEMKATAPHLHHLHHMHTLHTLYTLHTLHTLHPFCTPSAPSLYPLCTRPLCTLRPRSTPSLPSPRCSRTFGC